MYVALEQVFERHKLYMSVLLVFRLVLAMAVMTVAMVAVAFVVRMALVVVRNFAELEKAYFLMLLVATFAEIVLIHNAVGGKEYHQRCECSQYCICQFHRCKVRCFFDWVIAINKTLSFYAFGVSIETQNFASVLAVFTVQRCRLSIM